jgi:hypothetical protein
MLSKAQQCLGHSEADQLTVGQLRAASPTGSGLHHIVIDQHVGAVRRVFRSLLTTRS